MELEASLLLANNADIHGGNIFLDTGTSLTLRDTSVEQGTAILGGGIYVGDWAEFEMEGGALYANAAEGSGGQVWAGPNASLEFDNVLLQDGFARTNGGGIFATGVQKLEIQAGLLFNQSVGKGSGADVFVQNAQEVVVTGSFFAPQLDHTSIELRSVGHATWLGNAHDGASGPTAGALHADGVQHLHVGRSWFCNNSALTGAGALQLDAGCQDDCVIEHNVFIENITANVGGALGVINPNGSVDVVQNTFLLNGALLSAGVAYFDLQLSGTGRFERNLVMENGSLGPVLRTETALATLHTNAWYLNTLSDVQLGDDGAPVYGEGDRVLTERPLLTDPPLPGRQPCGLQAWAVVQWDAEGTDGRNDWLIAEEIGAFSNDADDDGVPELYDCDESDPGRAPGLEERIGDGVDQDCDALELCYVDEDGDGFGTADLRPVPSDDLWCDVDGADIAPVAGDCDDTDASVYPGAIDVPFDDIDQDCVDGDNRDADDDGYPADRDCDDADPAIGPCTWLNGGSACQTAPAAFGPWLGLMLWVFRRRRTEAS